MNKVTLLTRIFPEGERVSEVVVEYDSEIDGSNLTPDSYAVEAKVGDTTVERTIKKVYANSSFDLVCSTNRGRFVIIELDHEEAVAKTLVFSSETFLSERPELIYTVTQKVAITTPEGETIAPFTLQNTDEKRLIADDFQAFVYRDEGLGVEVPYRFFAPRNVNPDKKYPLVVFLHGAGERGRDNFIQLVANKGAVVWAQPGHQALHPSFVLAPQCPPESSWTGVLSGGEPFEPNPELLALPHLIENLVSQHNIDSDRIYVTGLSMGGFGTWAITMESPHLFAGAIPVCGGGEVKKVDKIKHIPIWAFHAEDDPLVPVAFSRSLVRSLVERGGRVKYTEFLKDYLESQGWSAHSSWIPAYEDETVINWLFEQKRGQ